MHQLGDEDDISTKALNSAVPWPKLFLTNQTAEPNRTGSRGQIVQQNDFLGQQIQVFFQADFVFVLVGGRSLEIFRSFRLIYFTKFDYWCEAWNLFQRNGKEINCNCFSLFLVKEKRGAKIRDW